MNAIAHIGSSIRIKGEVTAHEPLVVAGQVDGPIVVRGHALTIAAGGRVTADVAADTIIVCGVVHGHLNAAARILVRETATIEGNMSAPAVSFADGAMVHGRVETTARKMSALRLAS